jgi:hypothetical protein
LSFRRREKPGDPSPAKNRRTARGGRTILDDGLAKLSKSYAKPEAPTRRRAVARTGAISNRQKARKVVSSDNEWFTMTVLAQGNHLATWVNGFL